MLLHYIQGGDSRELQCSDCSVHLGSLLTGTNGRAERGEEAEMGVEKELPSTKLRGGTYECAKRRGKERIGHKGMELKQEPKYEATSIGRSNIRTQNQTKDHAQRSIEALLSCFFSKRVLGKTF